MNKKEDLNRWNELHPDFPCYPGRVDIPAGAMEESHYHKTLDAFCELVREAYENPDPQFFRDIRDRLGDELYLFLCR